MLSFDFASVFSCRLGCAQPSESRAETVEMASGEGLDEQVDTPTARALSVHHQCYVLVCGGCVGAWLGDHACASGVGSGHKG